MIRLKILFNVDNRSKDGLIIYSSLSPPHKTTPTTKGGTERPFLSFNIPPTYITQLDHSPFTVS